MAYLKMQNNLKIVATIEARMNSSRLPGKVMKKFGKYYLLEILIKRLKKSKLLDDIVVATTTNNRDKKIVNFLIKNRINFYRGSENNVNLRLIKAAEKFEADIIVQFTADNPYVDPLIIDYMINFYKKNLNKYDYISNCGLGDYSKGHAPLGFNTQIFLYKHLKENYKYCKTKELKEHPSLYFYREGKKKYKLKNISLPKKYETNLKIRLTIDTIEDLKLARLVYKKLGKSKNINFGLLEIIKFFSKNKGYLNINNEIEQKKVNLIL